MQASTLGGHRPCPLVFPGQRRARSAANPSLLALPPDRFPSRGGSGAHRDTSKARRLGVIAPTLTWGWTALAGAACDASSRPWGAACPQDTASRPRCGRAVWSRASTRKPSDACQPPGASGLVPPAISVSRVLGDVSTPSGGEYGVIEAVTIGSSMTPSRRLPDAALSCRAAPPETGRQRAAGSPPLCRLGSSAGRGQAPADPSCRRALPFANNNCRPWPSTAGLRA